MKLTPFKSYALIGPITGMGLFFFGAASASLTPINDDALGEINGANGIGIILNDAQILGDTNTTLEIDNDLATSDIMLDHLKLYNYDSADEGSTINSFNGITWGTPADPFRIDLISESAPKRDGSGNAYASFLQLAFPTGGTTTVNKTSYTNIGGNPASSGSRTIASIQPYDCTGSIDCATLSFRSRMDVYRITSSTATSADLALESRHIQWWEIAGVNFNGTKLKLWADDNDGLSAAISLVAHADTIRTTRASNVGSNIYTGGDQAVNYTVTKNGFDYNYIYTASEANINKTAPFSGDDSPDYNDFSKTLVLSDVDIEVHLGQLGYQPLTIEPVFTATNRSAPVGGAIQRDDGVLDIAITLAAITNANSEHFYSQPKGNISIGNIRMAADAAGNCINPSHTICDFGSASVEGLQVQYLQFRTQDLQPLTASHCPAGWSCSF